MFFFQLPGIPERLLARDNYSFAKRSLRAGSPGTFSDEDLERYVEAWSQPGALKGMINYYRAALRRTPRSAQAGLRVIEAQTLVIWGQRDAYIGSELAEPLPQWVPNVRVERLAEATHWVHHEAPEQVNELLVGFLSDAARLAAPAPSRASGELRCSRRRTSSPARATSRHVSAPTPRPARAPAARHDPADDRPADRRRALEGDEPQRHHAAAHRRVGGELQRRVAGRHERDAGPAHQRQRDQLERQGRRERGERRYHAEGRRRRAPAGAGRCARGRPRAGRRGPRRRPSPRS